MFEFLPSIALDMISFFIGDQKRIHHALKVHSFSSLLGRQEALSTTEQFCLEVAGYLHDMGIPVSMIKYGSASGNYQEMEGPPLARKLLEPYDLPPKVLERILFIIGHHHSFTHIDGPDFQLLMEADFLVNMYEENMSLEQIASISKNLFKSTPGRKILRELIPVL